MARCGRPTAPEGPGQVQADEAPRPGPAGCLATAGGGRSRQGRRRPSALLLLCFPSRG
uniref:Predicted protein n=1 Tax=Hordeum vulgare subsp. vulgare TaxID=112509 RepID=F2EFB0_HORVV|nr:predicted protein [Hordeum vulgare subsp. vulgare]